MQSELRDNPRASYRFGAESSRYGVCDGGL